MPGCIGEAQPQTTGYDAHGARAAPLRGTLETDEQAVMAILPPIQT